MISVVKTESEWQNRGTEVYKLYHFLPRSRVQPTVDLGSIPSAPCHVFS